VNLVVLQSPPKPPGGPGRRSTPRSGALFVNTSKGKDKNAKVHKSLQIRSKSPQNLIQRVVHEFRGIMELVSQFSEVRLIYYEFYKKKPIYIINKRISENKNT
jgi:hypothetical protein